MKKASAITCMFLDIGGVLLTNGWDHHARKRAATNFKLEWAEIADRHHLNFAHVPESQSNPWVHPSIQICISRKRLVSTDTERNQPQEFALLGGVSALFECWQNWFWNRTLDT